MNNFNAVTIAEEPDSQEPGGIIDNLADWMVDVFFPRPGQSINGLAEYLYECDGDEGYYFAGWLNSVDAIKTELINLYTQMQDDDIDIPEEVARELAGAGK